MVLNRRRLLRRRKVIRDCQGECELQLPSINLLREGEGSHKLDENELKFRRARLRRSATNLTWKGA